MSTFRLFYSSAAVFEHKTFILTRHLSGLIWTDDLKDQTHPHFNEIFGSGFIHTSDEDVEHEGFEGYRLAQGKKDETKFYFPTKDLSPIVPKTAKFLKLRKTTPWTHQCSACDEPHTSDRHEDVIYSFPDLEVVQDTSVDGLLRWEIGLDISKPNEHGNSYFHGIDYAPVPDLEDETTLV